MNFNKIGCLTNIILYPYILFVGKSKDNLQPISAWQHKDKAIETAESILKGSNVVYAEVVYMPEHDMDTNNVVWRSYER